MTECYSDRVNSEKYKVVGSSQLPGLTKITGWIDYFIDTDHKMTDSAESDLINM